VLTCFSSESYDALARRYLVSHRYLSSISIHADMLEVGRLSTYELNRAHFGAFAIVSSPLYLGIDLRQTASVRRVWDIISNKEVLAVNQNYVGDAGHFVTSWKHPSLPSSSMSTGALWAQMLYPDCDPNDPQQVKWSYDSSAHAVKYRDLCLDRADSINHLQLKPCDGSVAQKFNCTMNATTKTCKVRAIAPPNPANSSSSMELCMNANDWNWNNVYMDECGHQHYHTTQDFTFHSNGLLSSVQADFAGRVPPSLYSPHPSHTSMWTHWRMICAYSQVPS
jgi:hypothetical protein